MTVGAGIAVADPGDDGTVINACADLNNGQLRIVDGSEDCKNSEDFVTWSAEGPQGLVGPQGLQGIRGEPGTNGAPGLDGVDGLPGVDGTSGVDGADGAPGVDGIDGVPCSVAEDPPGTFTMTCSDSSASWMGVTTTTAPSGPSFSCEVWPFAETLYMVEEGVWEQTKIFTTRIELTPQGWHEMTWDMPGDMGFIESYEFIADGFPPEWLDTPYLDGATKLVFETDTSSAFYDDRWAYKMRLTSPEDQPMTNFMIDGVACRGL